MKINRQIIAIFILAVVLFPAPALANGGTALLWHGIIHLFVGNTFINSPKIRNGNTLLAFGQAEGAISGINPSENLRFRFSLETPFALWRVSHATHISGDFAVFQLGTDQICILQPQEKKIALITRGTSPVVKKAN